MNRLPRVLSCAAPTLRHRVWPGWLVLAAGMMLWAGTSHAHGLDAGRAILRLSGRTAVLVVTPRSGAFAGFDDDGNGLLHVNEVRRHRAAIQRRFEERVLVRDQRGVAPERVFADVIVPHAFDGTAPRGSDHVRFIYRLRWPSPPRAVSVRYGLFGPGSGEALTVQATRRRQTPHAGPMTRGAQRVETATLTSTNPRRVFLSGFAESTLSPGSSQLESRRASSGMEVSLPGVLLGLAGSGMGGAPPWRLAARSR